MKSWSQYGTTIAGSSSSIPGSNFSLLNNPVPIYYDQPDQRILVGDFSNRRIIQFSLQNMSTIGRVVAGGTGMGCGLNQFTGVFGLAIVLIEAIIEFNYATSHNLNQLLPTIFFFDSCKNNEKIPLVKIFIIEISNRKKNEFFLS